MIKYYALAITTSYWKPNDNYTDKIVAALREKIQNGDFVVVSEKAISTSLGNMVDESTIKPSLSARFLARFWMRLVWGYPLGMLCGFGPRLLKRLRNYPLESGSRHKQVALQNAGFWQALMFGSEGGIDGSNLPYSYVSLPLDNAEELAQKIQTQIRLKLRKNVCVVIADTDKTYKFHNFFFTPRPSPLRGIYSMGASTAYLLGRVFKLKKNSTPLAVAGCSLGAAEALKITSIADKARGPGSGATVWDMAARFRVEVNAVSWENLASLNHKPIVIVRKFVK
ncbi:MAG TPA: coenzyme F420-0:L-glutamate ligase [Candidatus Binatia bacterium]|nr:coenzyme F420-0:L-glutamate ligase [Candidatus Binatia bacterium]